MKAQSKFFLTILSFCLVLFSSCREESDELIEAEDNKSLKANSKVANLMLRTAMNDGSTDNILDGTTCFSVKLPVTVNVNGEEVVVDSEEDFITIQEIFDQLDDDIDELEFIYPITIVLSDFTEITIENEAQLEDFIESCDDSEEEDEDIECLDFQYPFEVSVFDSVSELIETIIFNNDRELFNFINNLDENDVVNLSFPITVVLSDDSTIVIQDLDMLEAIIEEAIDDCDENDLSEDRFIEVISSETLRVQKFKDNESNETQNYRDYTFDFSEDGTVVITLEAQNGDIITNGIWSVLTRADGGLNTTLDFGPEPPLDKLNKTWNVKKIKDKRIMLDDREDQGISKDELFFQQINN